MIEHGMLLIMEVLTSCFDKNEIKLIPQMIQF